MTPAVAAPAVAARAVAASVAAAPAVATPRVRACRSLAALTALLVAAAVCLAPHPALARVASLAGNVEPALEPPGDAVAVTAWSAPVDGRVAFVVTNGTSRRQRVERVIAVATQPDGTRSTKDRTRFVVPATLAAGEHAVGRVNLGRDVALDVDITWSVEARRARRAPAALEASGFQLSLPQVGPVAQTLAFTVTNQGEERVTGPARFAVLCFNEARLPAVLDDERERRFTLRPGASTEVVVELELLCPTYLVGADARVDR